MGSNFTTVEQADLLAATANAFTNAKATVDGLLAKYKLLDPNSCSVTESELRNLAKVCVGNSVYVMKLTRDITGGGRASSQVEFDFDANAEFCIIKIL